MFYLFKSAWKYADKDKWKLLVCYILHTISFGGELLQPFAFGMAVNALQVNGIDYLRPTISWFGLYLVGFFTFQVFHRSGRYFEVAVAVKNQQRFIDAVYTKLCKLPVKWHVDHHSGIIVNRMKFAGEALKDFCCSQSNFLEHITLSIGPIIVLAGVNYRITVISLFLITANLMIVFRLNKAIQSILDKITESYHTFSGRLSDFVSNIRTVITLKLGIQTKKELNNKFDIHYHECMREHHINQVRCLTLDIGGIVIEFAAVLLYIWSCRMAEDVFLIGNLVMIITYLRQMRDAIFQVASSFYDTMRWKAALSSVNVILNASQRQEALELKKELSPWNRIRIKNIGFNYCKSQFGLSVANLEFSRKSKIAIVGTSGSGKSTFLHLLAGLYDSDCAELWIDGVKHSSLNEIADSISLISQDVEILENTVLYNITFGLEPDLIELQRAIDSAKFREVIDRLPNGIHTDIREKGINLSGGERQRLALARGLYFSKTKSILLLDEVTSSVDVVNEKFIMEQILANNKERCVICSIHRLHLLDMFDTILVMNKGRIIERGNFSQLINSESYFKLLWDKYQYEYIRNNL